ncbi:MAG: hypothetical protein IJ567_02300 [Lachnospiraceae bacterium]|nr:hypothetical protein [Lachnospiraceae bacterium]
MEIKEFKTVGSEENKKSGKKRQPKATRPPKAKRKPEQKTKTGIGLQAKLKRLSERLDKAYLFLGGYILCAVVTVVLGIAVFHIPVLTAVLVLFIEAGMATCLHNLPVWLHGIVLVAELILGIAVSQTIFLVLLMLCYVFAILSLKYLSEEDALKKGETI